MQSAASQANGQLIFVFYAIAGLLLFGGAWWLVARAVLLVAPRAGRRDAAPAREPAQSTPRCSSSRGITTHAPVSAPDYSMALQAPRADWLRALNEQPDVNPHIAVCGPTRSGKTTLVTALLTRRPGRLVICTPKGADTDPWGGFPAVRLSYTTAQDGRITVSYGPIGAAIQAVYQEMARRNAVPGATREPLTLIIDELTNVNAECGGDVMGMIARLWTMGASCGIRLITLDPTVNVRGWGIEGRSDLRENLVFVRCSPDKSAVYYRWGQEMSATPIDTLLLPGMAGEGLDPARIWVPDAMQGVIERPTAQPAGGDWSAPASAQLTDHERAQVRAWAGPEGRASRALARRLYEARGGDDRDYDGSGAPFNAVRLALQDNVSNG